MRSLPGAQKIKEQMIIEAWPLVVGEEIAKKTEPLFMGSGLLLVRVTDPLWAQHISLQKRKIINALNRRAGTRVLKDLRFQTGPVASTALAAPLPEKSRPWLEIKLTEEETAAVEEALRQSPLVPELKDALHRALLSQKRWLKWHQTQG